jgi:hypothetical protein
MMISPEMSHCERVYGPVPIEFPAFSQSVSVSLASAPSSATPPFSWAATLSTTLNGVEVRMAGSAAFSRSSLISNVSGSTAVTDSMKSVKRKLGLPSTFFSRFQLQTQSSAVISLPVVWKVTPGLSLTVAVSPSSLKAGKSWASSGST